ncbi:MAG: uncharacterized protein QOE86_2383 [Solirubrobacteraceae bacterium]|nr:uncharacterized protein [Solirubrobacteraceae bacterium]
MSRRRLLPFLTLLVLLVPGAARAADVPPGAKWTEATISEPDGTQLHADILRPKDLSDTAKVPVILSIGPYFNHSGQTGPAGPVEDTGYDPVGPSTGPSDRFYDFVNGAKLMQRGYAFVMVDLRGFGGSSGCLDWAGPGEQADVKSAVEWAASQPWSTGRVGMYGKSYDGVTGLIGAVSNPKGLAAVVSQEPVYDLYRYLYSNGVRFENAVATPALYDAIAATPGPLLDSPLYNVGGATDPACLATNYAAQQDPDHGSDYWKARNLIARAGDVRVPLFMTQGFLENNTKPDGAWDFFNAVRGPKRGWFGMWDHVRGNDTDATGRLKMGRAGWFDEVMRFFDHNVRGVPLADAPTDQDPPVAVETSDGSWRSEAAWPPVDSHLISEPLRAGTYTDDGNQSGTGSGAGVGVWTISKPLASDAWYSGVPNAAVQVTTTAANANLVVDTYDIGPDRQAILLSRNASLIPAAGDSTVSLELYGNDWKIPPGHRLGLLVTGSNAEWWLHTPTNSAVQVRGGTVDLPFLRYTRDATIQGGPSLRLEDWLKTAPFEVPQATIDGSTSDAFVMPAALTAAPAAAAPTSAAPTVKGGRRLVARIARTGRRLAVYGRAPQHARVRIVLRRNGRIVRRATVKRTIVSAYRVTFKLKRPGRYRATVTASTGKTVLHAASRRVRVR